MAHESNDDDKTAGGFFSFDGMTFTVTERNEVAQVGKKGALGSESFFDAGKGRPRRCCYSSLSTRTSAASSPSAGFPS
jgi:hypothetical protein